MSTLEAHPYTFEDRPVVIPWGVDIAKAYLPGGKFAATIQCFIGSLTGGMREGDSLILPWQVKTHQVILPAAVPIAPGMTRHWGKLRWHRARRVGLTPIAQAYVPRARCNRVTLHVEYSGSILKLTRAYGGDYMPPLPWMTSAIDTPPRGAVSPVEFWRNHAVLLSQNSRLEDIIIAGSQTHTPPDWFLTR